MSTAATIPAGLVAQIADQIRRELFDRPTDPTERITRAVLAGVSAAFHPAAKSIAYHEAGHAIAALHLGVPFLSADIVRRSNTWGRVTTGRFENATSEAMVTLAGPLAATMFTGVEFDWREYEGSDADRFNHAIAECSQSIEDITNATRQLLTDQAPAIHRVAAALQEHGELFHDDVKALAHPRRVVHVYHAHPY